MLSQPLTEIFNKAVQQCRPDHVLPGMLELTAEELKIDTYSCKREQVRDFYIIAAGKAAGAMALEAEKVFGTFITGGLCVTKYHHALPLQRLKMLEAAHPVPDENSVEAGRQVLQLLKGRSEKDIVLFLISGGASSLVTDLPSGTSIADLTKSYQLLVNSGAAIDEINCVRKHLSRIKGGQLAKAAYPARIISLLISDVPGDDLQTIGSGPTVPDHSTFQEALNVVTKYGLQESLPASIWQHLNKGVQGALEETPKPGDPVFRSVYTRIIANNYKAAAAAKMEAEKSGFHVHWDKRLMTGNTDEEAQEFSQQLLHYEGPLPALFIRGGETTLRVSGNGKGGRNQHFALRALLEMKTHWNKPSGFAILSAGTDGTDGPTDAAGAIIHSAMLSNPDLSVTTIQEHLTQFNAYPFFAKTGGLIFTGPTQTNVMDIVFGMIY